MFSPVKLLQPFPPSLSSFRVMKNRNQLGPSSFQKTHPKVLRHNLLIWRRVRSSERDRNQSTQCPLRHRETEAAHLSAHHHRWNTMKLFVPPVYAACHYEFQVMVLISSKHTKVRLSNGRKGMEDDRTQCQGVP